MGVNLCLNKMHAHFYEPKSRSVDSIPNSTIRCTTRLNDYGISRRETSNAQGPVTNSNDSVVLLKPTLESPKDDSKSRYQLELASINLENHVKALSRVETRLYKFHS